MTYLIIGISLFLALPGCRCSSDRATDTPAGAAETAIEARAETAGTDAGTAMDIAAKAAATGATDEAAQPLMDTPADAEPSAGTTSDAEEPSAAKPPKAKTPKGTRIEDTVEMDRIVHDFGDILTSAGPQSCTFTLKNISASPISILQVVSSCGCTDVTWTREEIAPGESGRIGATYKNSDGAIPFDKTLTVYVAGLDKPFVLHLRGAVHDKPQPLSELYGGASRGPLGLKSENLKAGNMEQGDSRSGIAKVANLGKKPAVVEFTAVDPHLEIGIEPNPVPAGEVATLTFTVASDRALWGTNYYEATPVIDGKACEPLKIQAVTKENFSSLTKEQRDNAALPMFDESTVDLGFIAPNSRTSAAFPFVNKGKSTFTVYKAESDNPAATPATIQDTAAGGKGSVTVSLDATKLPKGEFTIMLTLYTNSPIRPLVSLFLVGIVK